MTSARTLELLLRRDADGAHLASPDVGLFTCALERGALVSAGARVGVLKSLGVARELVAPAGAVGRVVSERPERVNEPVGFGDVLYRLAPIEGAEDDVAGVDAAAGDAVLAVRAPYSGRFWHRPAPGEPPLVAAGVTLAAGQPIGLVEVMKTFSHLHYEPGGALPERARVVRVLADDGAEVGEGDALVEVEPA